MSGPIEQESKLGHELHSAGKDIYAEVSLYNGHTFVSIRRWFQADDKVWYRTKNGLHLRYDDMIEVLAGIESLTAFILRRAQAIENEPR